MSRPVPSSGSNLQFHLHVLDAANEARLESFFITRQLNVLESTHQTREHGTQLIPSKVRTQAEMFTNAETDVLIRSALYIECLRVVKHTHIAVRRWIEEREVLSCFDVHIMQGHVYIRDPAEMDDRTVPTHDLLDHRVEQIRIRPGFLQLIGMLYQCQQATGRRVPRGLISGRNQQKQVRQELDGGADIRHRSLHWQVP